MTLMTYLCLFTFPFSFISFWVSLLYCYLIGLSFLNYKIQTLLLNFSVKLDTKAEDKSRKTKACHEILRSMGQLFACTRDCTKVSGRWKCFRHKCCCFLQSHSLQVRSLQQRRGHVITSEQEVLAQSFRQWSGDVEDMRNMGLWG